MELYTPTEPRFDPALVKERFESAREEIGRLSGGRDIKLLAVTKTVPAEVINYAIDELGVTAIGENRVQELLDKYDKLHSPKGGRLEIHLIGSLQTNKVKYIADKVDMIESLDSLKLASEIDSRCKKLGRTMDVLVEVNIGREPQKGGVMPEELESFVSALEPFEALRLRGLMTIAPKSVEKSDYLKYFSETRQYFIDISKKIAHNIYGKYFDTLSMGMSDSYPAAIECGSTEIRLGSSLFGKRNQLYPESGSSAPIKIL